MIILIQSPYASTKFYSIVDNEQYGVQGFTDGELEEELSSPLSLDFEEDEEGKRVENHTEIRVGDAVLITDDSRELLYAIVVGILNDKPTDSIEFRSIVRKATKSDEEKQERCVARSQDAFIFCKEEISRLALPMKLISVEMLFSMTKLIFYFTAPERVDFRALIKALVEKYKERIELRQIGVRNEVQMLGGVGSCGRNCCCTTFMREFSPISVKVAKQNNVTLNPLKMSGICGRLSCCLHYEVEK